MSDAYPYVGVVSIKHLLQYPRLNCLFTTRSEGQILLDEHVMVFGTFEIRKDVQAVLILSSCGMGWLFSYVGAVPIKKFHD